jgi:hypothetical protein
MVDRNLLLKKLNPYVGNMQIVKYDQGTQDIIAELLKSHADQTKEYDKIYKYFVGRNVRATAKNIFDYLKHNVKYDIEPASKQTLKSASSIIAQGYGDCKQYAQFAGGILDAIKRNINGAEWFYRFASYNDKKMIQHVFVVVKDKNGKEIWIDPVLDQFDLHKPYNYKIDKKPLENMALYKISGTNDQVGKFGLRSFSLKNIVNVVKKIAPVAALVVPSIGIAKIGGKLLSKITQNGKVAEIAQKVINSKNKIEQVVKAVNNVAQVDKVVIKVDKTLARNAFLTLVASNKAGLATKLGAAMSRISSDLSLLWQDLGGDYNVLQSTILKGSRSAISGIDKKFNTVRIGEIVNSDTIFSTALPVIETLKPILDNVGVDVNSLVKTGTDEALNQVAQNIITTNQTPAAVDQQPVIENANNGQMQENVKSKVETSNGVASLTINNAGASGSYTKYIIPAAALAAIYLISKKK